MCCQNSEELTLTWPEWRELFPDGVPESYLPKEIECTEKQNSNTGVAIKSRMKDNRKHAAVIV